MTSVMAAPRLADYFAVLELDESQLQHGASVGVVQQRLPEREWEDVPFAHSIQMFCFPQGWNIRAEWREATYFVCILTDLMGSHQFACCLQTFEPCTNPMVDDGDDQIHSSTTLYKPKVFVLLSRFPYFDLFRVCLNKIFHSIKTRSGQTEAMIATILGNVKLVGKSVTSFNLGNERFSVRPLTQRLVPLTGCRITALVRNLGSLHNLLVLIRCILSDQKIIFHSSSLSRLSDASYALKCLIFPFEYTYTIVSALPELLLEYLESPTPYVMGVLSCLIDKVSSTDAVIVDLDLGEVRVPSSVSLPSIPEPYLGRLTLRLQLVLNPELQTCDYALSPCSPPVPDNFVMDKQIRACFLLFFTELLYGYRTCLQMVRLHRQPLIVFHKAAFLGMRRLSDPLINMLIDGQMFQLFIASRGIPYRECDVFDEVVCSVFDLEQQLSDEVAHQQIQKLSNILVSNEKQEQIMTTNVPRINGEDAKTHETTDSIDVVKFDQLLHQMDKERSPVKEENVKMIVPVTAISLSDGPVAANSRRLQVLKACVEAITENRLSDARKMMCAVELSLRFVEARVYLCRLLCKAAVPVTKATLSPQQFELVVRLLNCALEHESEEDEHGIAYACLHLSNIYCRCLSQGVHQFAYTCVQKHPVWKNHRFWEAAFFHDVHELVKRYYGKVPAAESPLSGNSRFDMWNLLEEPTSMAVTADQLQNFSQLTQEEKEECKTMEESTVYGQAKHYINLMIYLRVPLDVSKLRTIDKGELEQRGQTLTRDRMDSLSDSDAESGYIESVNDGDLGNVEVNWISRLIDRLCSAAGLEGKMTERLIQDIPGFVAIHVENLEQVYLESKKLAPPPKSKLLSPVLLTPCEQVLSGGLRCVLLPDTKLPTFENIESSTNILPAEGAVFLTNYRIVFKGRPLNPYLSEEIVVRSMPIMSLTKEKSIPDQILHTNGQLNGVPTKIAHGLHDPIQIRSSSFQLFRLAFDEEVSWDSVEEFIKTLTSRRWPQTLPQSLFAFNPVSHLLATAMSPGQKGKFSTIRDLKKNIIRPIKGSLVRRPETTVWSPNAGHRYKTTPAICKTDTLTNGSDYLDLDSCASATLTANPFHKRHLVDYERLRLKAENSIFRISYANAHYDIAKTYPSCFVVPTSVSDDIFTKVSKGFKHGRFPVITWISDNGALLIRGSALNTNVMLNKIKKQANLLHPTESSGSMGGSRLTLSSKESGTDLGPQHSSEYQEHYLTRLAQVSPTSAQDNRLSLSDSITSMLSLESFLTVDGASMTTATPDMKRKSTNSEFSRHSSQFLRTSGGRPGAKHNNLSAKPSTTFDRQLFQRNMQSAISKLNRKNLYVLVDKAHCKVLRVEKNTEFVPIVYPSTTTMKAAFKKFLRTTRPSWPHMENSFLVDLDDSGWLNLVNHLLSLSSSLAGIITTFNSSIALCIEDGWDATCQIMSLVQILMDSHYRTFDGFRVLIEKEWLAFGHRFSHRANHTISSQKSGIAPVFMLFLDAVHQLLTQFPFAFEFNDFYLRFLAYHSTSAFFRTFLLDSESERIAIDRMAPDTSEGHRGCIWTYIQNCKSPIFHNLMYDGDYLDILVPSSSVAALDVWSFYTNTSYNHGAPYDIEIAESELAQGDEELLAQSEGVTQSSSYSRIIDGELKCIDLKPEDKFTYLLQTHDRENPLDKPQVGHWKDIWSVVEERKKTDTLEEMDLGYDKYLQKLLQKKAALRVLLKGVASQVTNSKLNVPKSHHFEHYSAHSNQPTECSLCHFPLYGTVVKTGQHCRVCGIVAHDKCIVNITWSCGVAIEPASNNQDKPEKPFPQSDSSSQNLAGAHTLTIGSSKPHIVHHGYLSKKGARIKLKTPRWFMLDATNHKLCYSESETDNTCRGFIDLCDVSSVEVDGMGSKATLVLHTNKKVYHLQADKRSEAELWKEKIEHVLRD